MLLSGSKKLYHLEYDPGIGPEIDVEYPLEKKPVFRMQRGVCMVSSRALTPWRKMPELDLKGPTSTAHPTHAPTLRKAVPLGLPHQKLQAWVGLSL